MRLKEDIILLFLTAVIYVEAQNAQLNINPQGDTILRAEQQNVVFTCTVVGMSQSSPVNLQWYNSVGQRIQETQGRRVYIEQSGPITLKLYILRIVPTDSGDYTCRGTVNGNDLNQRVSLAIYKDITFEHAPVTQHPTIYTDAIIECRVDGKPEPEVSFRKGEQRIVTTADSRYVIRDDGLMIRNITKTDNGIYVCRAEVLSNGNMRDQQITVDVYTPPTITRGPGTAEEGIEGHDVSLYCTAEGYPDPKYEFRRNNNQQPMSSDNRISIDGDAGAIHFRPLMKEDEGDYVCVASNAADSVTDRGHLSVIVPPQITTLDNVTVDESRNRMLSCIVEADPPADISFKKVGLGSAYTEGRNDGGRIVVRKPAPNRLDMTINNVNIHDTSNYTCIAANKGGRDERNGTVTVRFSPRFEDPTQEVVYNWPGKGRNITCHSLAEPTPHITWWRGPNMLQPNVSYRIFDMGHSSSLYVYVRTDDIGWIFGNYECKASNEINPPAFKPFVLTEATPPGPPNSVSVKEHSPTTVTFTIVAPEDNGGMDVVGFRVMYEDHTAEIHIGDDFLIENLRPSTSYLFRFTARNEVGVGFPIEYTHRTDDMRAPYTIRVVSDKEGTEPYQFTLNWDTPRTGGVAIRNYIFKIRRMDVEVHGEEWRRRKPIDERWTQHEVEDNAARPRQAYTILALKPNTFYEVEVIARNEIGDSVPESPPFLFRTAPGMDGGRSLSATALGMSVGSIIGVIIAVTILFLIIVDVSCYFMNGCGVLMCMCVHLCGKRDGLLKEKVMEEGENYEKKPLSEGTPGNDSDAEQGEDAAVLEDRIHEDDEEDKTTGEGDEGGTGDGDGEGTITDKQSSERDTKQSGGGGDDDPISEDHIGELSPDDKPEIISDTNTPLYSSTNHEATA